MGPRDANGHDNVREQYDEVASLFEEGRARMALYLRHCQDPVIFRTLGDLRGKSLLDLACGDVSIHGASARNAALSQWWVSISLRC